MAKHPMMRMLLCVPAALVLLSVLGCGKYDGDYGDNTSLPEISKATRLRFPASTTLVHGQNRTFEDSEFIAELSMSRSNVSKFLASVPGKRKTSRTDRMGVTTSLCSFVKWWRPDAAHHFVAVVAEGPGRAETYQILVSLDDPRRAVVYLAWGED